MLDDRARLRRVLELLRGWSGDLKVLETALEECLALELGSVENEMRHALHRIQRRAAAVNLGRLNANPDAAKALADEIREFAEATLADC